MKLIIFLIPLYVTVLPSIVQAYEELKNILDDIATKHKCIRGIFKPLVGGFLGSGDTGITYKGFLSPIEKEIAMKFTPFVNNEEVANEYKMYTYLNAINNSSIELYGIPSVYFYGSWRDYVLMGITLIDPKFNNKKDFYVVDILIAFREFVRISKYIHSRGIYHNDISLANFMFRLDRGFIVDFGLANRMYTPTTLRLTPQKARKDVVRLTRDDWANFLFSMSKIIGLQICCFGNIVNDEQFKENFITILESIYFDELRNVFLEFANAVLDQSGDNAFSPYDRLYNFIETEIQRIETGPPYLVSWLSDEERSETEKEFKRMPIPAIDSINDPFNLVEIIYQPVNPEFFDKLYHDEMNAVDAVSSFDEEYKTHHLTFFYH